MVYLRAIRAHYLRDYLAQATPALLYNAWEWYSRRSWVRQCLQRAAGTHPHKSTHTLIILSPLLLPIIVLTIISAVWHLNLFTLSGQLLVGGSTLRGFALIATETESGH